MRSEPKTFKQRRPDGKGGWVWNLNGIRRIPYNLPAVLKTKFVLILEGEKDCDTASALGLVATCNPGGAGKWRSEYSEYLRGKRVVAIADADKTGLKHAREVASALLGVAQSVRLIEVLPGGHKDLSDWVAVGGTREALLEIIKRTPELKPENAARWASRNPAGGAQEWSAPPNPWLAAQDMTEFLAEEEGGVEFLEPRLVALGEITELFSPRGLGKSQMATCLAVKIAKAGRRVLYLDRDNSRHLLKKRLRAWGAEGLKTLKALGREQIPPLTNSVAWGMFPYRDFDLVIVDSFDSHAEGVGEQDSGKPSRAIAPLLDIAHRENGPAVLVLGNCVRTGKHSRGSGVIEDRADITFEVRDVTGWTPTGTKCWWEELPAAGAADWASRATRKNQRDKIRLAFVCTKFRSCEEPEAFVLEIDFTTEPHTLREVTDSIDLEGSKAREARQREQEEIERMSLESLRREIRRRFEAGEPPMRKEQDAVPFLMRIGLKRGQARDLLLAGDGKHWNLAPDKGKHGRAVTVTPFGLNQSGGEKGVAKEAAKTEGVESYVSRRPHEQPLARNNNDETSVSTGSDNGAFVAADPQHSGEELPLEGEL